jgi:subtilisin family serine protease
MTKDGNGNDTGSGGWADALDQGANGYVDDLVGWNRFSNNKTPTDGYGHGTHVSGTIGAIGNNNVGVAGVNWKAQIMTLKIFSNSGGYVGDTGVIQMFDYAVANGAQLSNHSWGGGGFSQAMKDAISAMGSAGHIFVAAAGNNGANNDVNKFYPATYGLPNIISVAATDSADNKASFSNYGANSVHLGAPGVNVNSTLPTTGSLMGTNYGQASGTSMASPHTAGSIALLWSQHPNYSYRRVIRQILNFVDKVPSMNGKSITGGRLNVGAAVVNAPGAPIPPAPGLAARQAEQTAALGAGLVSSGQADSTILGAGEVHYASPWGDTVNVASAQRLVARPNVVDAEWVDVDFASWA